MIRNEKIEYRQKGAPYEQNRRGRSRQHAQYMVPRH